MIAHSRSKQQTFFLILLLGLLNAVTPFSIDMYLPAFPEIARDLHTTVGNIALSVSTYFLGFALGQILYGPLLDRFGRKKPLYAGLCVYIIATLCCATSGTLTELLTYRFVQALGGSVASVAAMAMVLDFFPPDESSKIISLLVLILGLSPMLAPTTGSFIVVIANWHWVFAVLAIMAALLLILVVFFLPEGHAPDKSVSLKPTPIINTFKSILFVPQFYIYSLAGTFSFAGLFAYVAGSPAIFMDEFHLSPKAYGGIFALLSVGFIGGSQLTHILAKRFTNAGIFRTAVIVQVSGSIIFLIGLLNGWYGLAAEIVLLFVILSCAGLTYPNAASIAISPFSKNAGSASSLLGFIQIGIGGIISSGIGLMHVKGSLATAIIMTASAGVALIILQIGKLKIKELVAGEVGAVQGMGH